MDTPSVLVLVLTYNTGPPLEACLRSLQAATCPNARLVVIDNGSTDGSVETARRMGVEVHPYGENLGYCAAYNRAFRELGSDFEFLLLSNPDVAVPPETIGRMVARASGDPAIGFVGPVQRHADDRTIRSAGIQWRCGHLPAHTTDVGQPYDALEGAFLLVRSTVVERVGVLDETLALNLEDVEWQLRARRQGFRAVLAADAEILHLRPGPRRVSTGAYYQTRNACILTARFCDPWALHILMLRLRLEGLAATVLGRPRGRFILEGLSDFRRGRVGMRVNREQRQLDL